MKFIIAATLILSLFCIGHISIEAQKTNEKLKDEEDIYGDLKEDGEDGVQQDQEDYYVDPKNDNGEGDDYAEEANNNDLNIKLSSKAMVIVSELGGIVKLPCVTNTKDEIVRIWTKDTVPIYQGNILLSEKHNLKLLENGTFLQVILEDIDDFGKYSCKLAISSDISPEVVHEVIRKIAPNITSLTATNNDVVFNVGQSFTLTCQASGYPKPKISWFKDNDRLGTEGESLTIENIKARHAGSYRCLADNNVGRPAHSHIQIFVNHAPIVTLEKYIVNSDHENDAELVCEVKAYPISSVVWQRTGQNIVSNEPKIILKRERDNERNILIIKNINEADFGQYTCVATNSLGKQSKTLNLVKTPALRKFEKNHTNENAKDVVLQWRVESKQPVSEHEIQYRKKGETNWKTASPTVDNVENDVYLIKHTLKNLEPGVYETRARSKNNHGWSDYSEIIPFDGTKHNSNHPKSKHTKEKVKDKFTTAKMLTDSSSMDVPAQQRTEQIEGAVGESTSSGKKIVVCSWVQLFLIGLITASLRC